MYRLYAEARFRIKRLSSILDVRCTSLFQTAHFDENAASPSAVTRSVETSSISAETPPVMQPVLPATAAPDPGHLAFWCAWAVTAGAYLVGELLPAWLAGEPQPTPWQWLVEARVESLVWLAMLALGPIAWKLRATRPQSSSPGPGGAMNPFASTREPAKATRFDLGASFGVGTLAIVVCLITGRRFAGLPPAYHDEFSYLFQAKTFLAGRVAFDSPPLRELFDQMHVLNEGKMASRYFPATGFWMAPFVALGAVEWSGWFAQGLFAVLVYWIGREISGRSAGVVAAVLVAVCPGLVLFSNLLLAHHPTLLGLGVFLLGILRMLRLDCRRYGLVAGGGLAFAALARPMTAASIGLPWGLYLLWRGVHDRSSTKLWPALGGPLLAAGGLMLAYDAAITGHPLETPYGLYTRLHTPRHVFGFNNVERGAKVPAPRVIEHYDQWAENLTPELAGRNARNRLLASAQWTIGILPLTFGAVLGLSSWRRLSTGARLCFASIVSLHIAHIPYWYDGIFHFHYVFESLPLWLLFVGAAGSGAAASWRAAGRGWVALWCLAGLMVAVALNYTTEQGLWSAPYRDGTSQVVFARRKQADFQQRLAQQVTRRPALVLVEPDPADRHIDFVVNDPPLTGDVLIGRFLPDRDDARQIHNAWPGRTLYRYHVRSGEITLWDGTR